MRSSLNNIKLLPPTEPVPVVIGGCAGTQYGCCPDGITPKMNIYGTNCIGYVPPPTPKPIGGCAGTIYGCCLDGVTPKMNPYGTNCPGYPPPPPPPPPRVPGPPPVEGLSAKTS